MKMPIGLKVKSQYLKELEKYLPVREITNQNEPVSLLNGLPIYVDDNIEKAYEWIY